MRSNIKIVNSTMKIPRAYATIRDTLNAIITRSVVLFFKGKVLFFFSFTMNKRQFELTLGKRCVLATINYIEFYHNQLESLN